MSLKSQNQNNAITAGSKEDPLEFQVFPHVGLKNEHVEFLLGMPINLVTNMIQQNARLLQEIHLSYPRKKPFNRDVCVNLSADGIKLYFDASSQLLKLIEVDNLSRIVLKYRDTIFSEPGAEASMEKVNEYFGSTHPGVYDEKQKMYVQSWPGLSFCFPTDASGNVEVAPGFGPNLRSLKYDVTTQPRLTKMSIYKGASLSRPEPVSVPLECYCGQNRTKLATCEWKDGKVVGLNIAFETQSGAKVDGNYELTTMSRTLYFGDTVSAVHSALGAPSKVFYKSEDKMSIHRGATKETLKRQPNFFFNYFSMGLDVLFDFASKRVIKFVLHTNVPGQFAFGMYTRCEFAVKLGENFDALEVTTRSKFDDFSTAFSDPNAGETASPVVIQRNSQHEVDPFGPTFGYGIPQVVVEVMENGHVVALTIYDDRL